MDYDLVQSAHCRTLHEGLRRWQMRVPLKCWKSAKSALQCFRTQFSSGKVKHFSEILVTRCAGNFPFRISNPNCEINNKNDNKKEENRYRDDYNKTTDWELSWSTSKQRQAFDSATLGLKYYKTNYVPSKGRCFQFS